MPRHRLLAEILRLMPLYSDIRDLGAWESAFNGALAETDDTSEMGQLLYGVFELGQANLYGAFDAGSANRAFSRLAERFRASGIRLDQHRGLNDW